MAEPTEWIDRRLAGEGPPLIIDGGMGTELEKAEIPMNGACWSGLAVLDYPDTVRKIHTDFIRAGAEVIITNTFASGRHVLGPAGKADHVRAINTNAVSLARQAIEDAASGPVAIAGSLCEWSYNQNDGEWSSPETAGRALREQASLLAEAGADLITIEMAQDTVLSPVAIDAAAETGLPVWLGLSCRRRSTGARLTSFDHPDIDFESYADSIVVHARQYPNVTLVNVMHTPVPDVADAMAIVRKSGWSGPVGVYPESGFFKMPNWQFVDVITPEDLVAAARVWVDTHGLRLLGGCCGLGPAHISALRADFGP
ncbi:MAG: homocysteine S-methyltransferase family protein [Alphaproteobacteria bacterium]